MMDNPKFKSALIGGGAFGVAAALPYISMLNAACCALYIGGGVLAVYMYVKEQSAPLKSPYGDGALVGLMAGALGGVVATIVNAILVSLGLAPDFGDPAESFAQLEEMGVEVPAFLRSMSGADGVNAAMLGTQLVVNVILFGIFATIGGLVGIAIFGKNAGESDNSRPGHYDT